MDLRDVLGVELIGLTDLLALESQEKGWVKEDAPVSDLENWVAGDAICWNMARERINTSVLKIWVCMTYPKEYSWGLLYTGPGT